MRESSLLNGSLQNKTLRGVLWGVHAGFACILAVTRLGRVLSGVRTSKRRDAKVPTNADTSSKAHSCPPDPHNVGRKSGIQRFDRPISDSCTGNGRKRAFLGRLWSGRDSIRPTPWLASLLSGMIKSCRSTIHETTCKEKQPQRRASGEDGWLVSGGGMVQHKHMDPVGCGQVLSVRRCVLEGLVKIMRSCHRD